MSSGDFSRYGRRIVRMIWDPQPKAQDAGDVPLWCLGRSYAYQSSLQQLPQVADAQELENGSITEQDVKMRPKEVELENAKLTAHDAAESDGWPPGFLDDFESLISFTYRSNFPMIPRSEDALANGEMSFAVRLKLLNHSGFTSDTGWGCMIRSGQSLLANTLRFQALGRDNLKGDRQTEENKLLSMFADDPRAPFSIHNFVSHGATACGKYPGVWFGPSATAKCIEALVHHNDDIDLKVYVTGDGPDIFEDQFLSLAIEPNGDFKPTMLLVGTRLGIDRVTPVYHDALLESLRLPQALGIVGGRPSSSHYFVGAQGNSLLYLDPHQTQPGLVYHEDASTLTDSEIDACHTRQVRQLPIEDIDPSMLVGFLFDSREDWVSWRTSVSKTSARLIFRLFDSREVPSIGGAERNPVDDVEALDDDDSE